MITKTGKRLLIFIGISYSYLLCQSVTLEVTNSFGIPLTSIQTGAPFSLNVSLKGIPVSSMPTIDSLEKLTILGQRVETRQQGVSQGAQEEVRVIYTVLAPKPGTLTLGPARTIDDQKRSHSSNSETITVIEGTYPAQSYALAPTYTLSIPQKRYVVGERIPFTLTFTYQRADVKLTHLETVHGPTIELGHLSTGHARAAIKEGELFSLIEYQGYFYPTTAGTLIIEPLRADYTLSSTQNKSSPFGFFLGRALDQKRSVSTEQKHITIDPLPPTDRPVSLIGELTQYTASLSTHEAQRGEALLLTLSLEGRANFDALTSPTIQLPESIRIYESKSMLSKTAQGEKKEWEFILQGLKEGTYVLPAQELFYFDTKTRSYRTIATNEIPFTIHPGVSTPLKEKPEEQESSAQSPEAGKQPAPFSQIHYAEIPWTVFCILLSIPLIVSSLVLLSPFLLPSLSRHSRCIYEKWILFQAQKSLQRAQRSHDASLLYTLIKRTITAYLQVPETATSEEIAHALHKRGIPEAIQEEWLTLHRELVEYSSYAEEQNKASSSALFNRASAWIKQLKKASCRPLFFILACLSFQTFAASEEFSQNSMYSLLSSLSSFLPFIVWQILVLITWYLFWYYATVRNRKRALVCIFLLCCTLIGWTFQAHIHYYPTGTVGSNGALLYLGPDTSYALRGTLQSDEKVTIERNNGLWYYVSSPIGNGWVKMEDVISEAKS